MLEFLQGREGPRAIRARKNRSEWAGGIYGKRTFTVPSSSPVAKKCGERYRTRFIGALSHTQCS